MTKLFPTYEIGSLPKLTARVNAIKGKILKLTELNPIFSLANEYDFDCTEVINVLERLQGRKPSPREKKVLIDFNALLNLKAQEHNGLHYVYDGEARRVEMYRHVARKVAGFQDLPEMLRSRGPDSWRAAVCVEEPRLKGSLADIILDEFAFVKKNARRAVKVPLNDPYMMANMTDNRYYLELLQKQYTGKRLQYEAKRALTLALAKNVIRPQVEALKAHGAKWIQFDVPAATLDLEHLPIMVEGMNAVVEDIVGMKFSVHFCYPRRRSLTDKRGYELLFPHIEDFYPNIDHLSLELANADQYETDLQPFAESRRRFEIGLGVVDITAEQRNPGTSKIVAERILRAANVLGDPELIYVAPDCGLRQLTLRQALHLYKVITDGAKLARKLV